MTVLLCGHACFDTVARVPRQGSADEKVEASAMVSACGGPAANAAVALRRLGHEVRLWCALGDDFPGDWVRRSLEREGVALVEAGLRRGSTSLAQIRAVGDARSVVWKRGTTAPLQVSAEQAHERLRDVRLLYLDGHEVEAARVLLGAARTRRIPVMVDFGSLRPGVRAWLRGPEWVAVSPRFAQQFCPEASEPAAQLEALARAAAPAAQVLVTAGEQGCWWRAPEGVRRVRARSVEVVDTTGAGDAFHAGLADAMLTGVSGLEAIEGASTLAAGVCRALGGQAGLPEDRAQLRHWCETWAHRPAEDARR